MPSGASRARQRRSNAQIAFYSKFAIRRCTRLDYACRPSRGALCRRCCQRSLPNHSVSKLGVASAFQKVLCGVIPIRFQWRNMSAWTCAEHASQRAFGCMGTSSMVAGRCAGTDKHAHNLLGMHEQEVIPAHMELCRNARPAAPGDSKAVNPSSNSSAPKAVGRMRDYMA